MDQIGLKLLLIGFAIFDEVKDYLAQHEIIWKFNASKAAWRSAMYERLIKTSVGSVVSDIERYMNNRPPLTYSPVAGGGGALPPREGVFRTR